MLKYRVALRRFLDKVMSEVKRKAPISEIRSALVGSGRDSISERVEKIRLLTPPG